MGGLEGAHPPRPGADRRVALVEIAIPHLVGGRLSFKVPLAGEPLEFEGPDNWGH